jgi:hypothetical protein
VLFAVCSDRGAPGATTLALALSSARGLPSVVVEADPYGGDLALRCRVKGAPLPPTPTVLGLGAGMSAAQAAQMVAASYERNGHASRDSAGQSRRLDLWREGSHKLSDMVRVVPGFLTAELGSTLAWSSVAATAESQVVPVFADIGRIHTASPSMPIAAAAEALVTVCRGDVASVQHMIWRLEQLVPAIADRNGRTPLVVPVVVTGRREGAHAAGQVAELLAETPVGPTLRGVGWVAWDPAAVADLYSGGDPWAKPLRTSALMKSTRKVMWLLGLATGLDHAYPYAEAKRARRTRWKAASSGDVPTEGRTAADPPVPAAGEDPPPLPTPRAPGAVNGAAVTGAAANAHAPSFEGLRRQPRVLATPVDERVDAQADVTEEG